MIQVDSFEEGSLFKLQNSLSRWLSRHDSKDFEIIDIKYSVAYNGSTGCYTALIFYKED